MLFQTLTYHLKKALASDKAVSGNLVLEAAPQSVCDYSPLRQLQQQRQHLEVSIESDSQRYQSLILAIDSARKLLWIDELFPAVTELSAGTELTLRHHCGGEVLTLQSPLIARNHDYGTQALALLLPSALEYLPRRQHPRFDLRSSRLGVTFRTPGAEESGQGTLINLSEGGMRLAVPGNQLQALKPETLLSYCQFSLPNQTRIRCQAVVKAVRLESHPYRHTQVSLVFADRMSDRERLSCYLEHLQGCLTGATQAA